MKLRNILIVGMLMLSQLASAGNIYFYDGRGHVSYNANNKLSPVVSHALEMFAQDMLAVTGKRAQSGGGRAPIRIYQLNMLSDKEFGELEQMRAPISDIIARRDAYWIGIRGKKIIVMGSNGRGTAYGILELSRQAGVSPWIWWGDARPQQRKVLYVSDTFQAKQWPAVAWRGVRLCKPLDRKFTTHLMELMLRLKANMIWCDSQSEAQHVDAAEAERFSIAVDYPNNAAAKHKHRKNKKNPDYEVPPLVKSTTHGITICRISDMAGTRDHLFLPSTQPGMIAQELQAAWQQGNNDIWVAQIGNPKSAGYGLQLFSDMAWNPRSVDAADVTQHLSAFIAQTYGTQLARNILPIWEEYYRLAAICKPEMIGSRALQVSNGNAAMLNTEMNPDAFGNELARYIKSWSDLLTRAERQEKSIPYSLRDAFEGDLLYPIRAAFAIAQQQLEAQESRDITRPGLFYKDDEALTAAANSLRAHSRLLQVVDAYNKIGGGKFDGLVNPRPSDCSVFAEPSLPGQLTEKQIAQRANEQDIYTDLRPLSTQLREVVARNAFQYDAATAGVTTIAMLGRSMKAVAMPQMGSVSYRFRTSDDDGTAVLHIAAAATQVPKGSKMLLQASIDGGEPVTITFYEGSASLMEACRMRSQIIADIPVNVKPGSHTLTLRALDQGIILDQWMLDFSPERDFFVFPVE